MLRRLYASVIRAWLQADIVSLESWRDSLMRNGAFFDADLVTAEIESLRVRVALLEGS